MSTIKCRAITHSGQACRRAVSSTIPDPSGLCTFHYHQLERFGESDHVENVTSLDKQHIGSSVVLQPQNISKSNTKQENQKISSNLNTDNEENVSESEEDNLSEDSETSNDSEILLTGITRFIFFSKLNSRQRVLLIGSDFDEETRKGLNKWLLQLLINAPKCVDIFTSSIMFPELDFHVKNEREYGWIDQLQGLVGYNSSKIICPKKSPVRVEEICVKQKVRRHEIRLAKINTQSLMWEISGRLFRTAQMEKIRSISASKYEDMFAYASGLKFSDPGLIAVNELFTILSESFYEYDPKRWFGKFFERGTGWSRYEKYRWGYLELIKKQMDKIPDFELDHFYKCIRDAYKEKRSTSNFVDILATLHQDIHILLRFLHRYNPNRMDRGPLLCRDSQYNRHVYSIIYTDGATSAVYARFFMHYFNILPTLNLPGDSTGHLHLSSFDFFQI